MRYHISRAGAIGGFFTFARVPLAPITMGILGPLATAFQRTNEMLISTHEEI